MTDDGVSSNFKDDLLSYLQLAREALIWKLEGLSEYDIRRPMTGTGTNLLGLVKHTATNDAQYLGEVFDRPFGEPMPWEDDDAEPDADMWATADESREWIVDFYRRAAAHSDETVAALPLDAPGVVPWWRPERRNTTLHRVLVHLLGETTRHAGHADILRESIDDSAGLNRDNDNMATAVDWPGYRARLEEVARGFR